MVTEIAEAESAPTLYRFTVGQYHLMIEAGILTENDRVELIEGVVVGMSPMGPRHAAVVASLNRIIVRLLPDDWHVRCQSPITLSDSEPEPDLAVVCGSCLEYVDRKPGGSDTGLVIEVSETSLEVDREKAALYAIGGLSEYWIVNLIDSQIEVHRDLRTAETSSVARYGGKQILRRDDTLPLTLEGATAGHIRLSDVLPGPGS